MGTSERKERELSEYEEDLRQRLDNGTYFKIEAVDGPDGWTWSGPWVWIARTIKRVLGGGDG